MNSSRTNSFTQRESHVKRKIFESIFSPKTCDIEELDKLLSGDDLKREEYKYLYINFQTELTNPLKKPAPVKDILELASKLSPKALEKLYYIIYKIQEGIEGGKIASLNHLISSPHLQFLYKMKVACPVIVFILFLITLSSPLTMGALVSLAASYSMLTLFSAKLRKVHGEILKVQTEVEKILMEKRKSSRD